MTTLIIVKHVLHARPASQLANQLARRPGRPAGQPVSRTSQSRRGPSAAGQSKGKSIILKKHVILTCYRKLPYSKGHPLDSAGGRGVQARGERQVQGEPVR